MTDTLTDYLERIVKLEAKVVQVEAENARLRADALKRLATMAKFVRPESGEHD